MAKKTSKTADRVRRNTSTATRERLDREAEERLASAAAAARGDMDARLDELAREWDIERYLEANASAIALSGLALGTFVDRRLLAVPAVVLGFLMQHAVQGWCPPVEVFRRMGVRTRQEIDRERYALKALRGDFEGMRLPAGSAAEGRRAWAVANADDEQGEEEGAGTTQAADTGYGQGRRVRRLAVGEELTIPGRRG